MVSSILCVKLFSISIILSNSSLERRWSTTHGFFIIMGGFHLFERSSEKQSDSQNISQEDDDPLHPLLASDLMHDNIYSFAMPTEAEIKDKGKSDWLAKSLVLLQTSWFVTQCVARAIKHLPVTHLEIVTLAYAAMNFVTYIFWWNKPLNVNRPVRVVRKSEVEERQPPLSSEVWELTWETIRKGLETIVKSIIGGQDEDVDLSHQDRVPRFWADNTEDFLVADFPVLGVGVCFGAIHCIAWAFQFPTHTELLMWRISSVAITAVPIYIFLGIFLAAWVDNADISVTEVILFLPPSILYIFARAVTLVLAFTSLRNLPPGAYETVHWTTFIPHI